MAVAGGDSDNAAQPGWRVGLTHVVKAPADDRAVALLGRPARFTQVPVALLDTLIAVLGLLGRLWPALADKAELARIGRYYATESMLVLNPATGRYDAALTPETGTDTLFDHYRAVLSGEAAADARGDHAVF